MWNRFVNLSHLLLGVVLLGLAVFSIRELALNGQSWWQQQESKTEETTAQARLEKNDDASARETGVYGLLGEDPSPRSQPIARVPEPAPAIDRVAMFNGSSPSHLVDGRVAVRDYRAYKFEIPPHMPRSRVEGMFRCLGAGQSFGNKDRVELMLMSEDEFARFSDHEVAGTMFSARVASFGDVEWDLKPTYGVGRDYYLVMRNASQKPGAAVVDADFTVTAE